MTIRKVTPEENAALAAFAAAHGRTWKSKLREVYWYNARVWNGLSCLHALRNDPRWGHAGLEAFRFEMPARDLKRLDEALGAMSRLRATFKTGDNRFGEYGRNCREAFERHAKVYAEITGKPAPSIYD